jgi:hypothetical protein
MAALIVGADPTSAGGLNTGDEGAEDCVGAPPAAGGGGTELAAGAGAGAAAGGFRIPLLRKSILGGIGALPVSGVSAMV